MSNATDVFADPQAVARYAEGPPRLVPGFADLQRMSMLLLAERTAQDGRVLVVGAGGGLELKVFAENQPGWRFEGVDPSAEMLKLAESTLGPLMSRVRLHHGYIDVAPAGPFDAAACLLTLHYVQPDERLRTIREIRRRLKPGAPLVVAHLSFPQGEEQRALWLSRYVSFAVSSGVDPEKVANARAAIDAQLPILPPEQDEAILRDGGFANINLFYAGLTFRGWVGYAT
jgi:tRNA (cmo5U34)-methyltransferase